MSVADILINFLSEENAIFCPGTMVVVEALQSPSHVPKKTKVKT